jgi:hypothetical protein
VTEKRGARLNVQVVDRCTTYPLPARFQKTVERLLLGVSPKYLAGLQSVVLRDSGNLTRHEKKKRERLPGMVLLGTYYHRTRTTAPQIHLFVDKILRTWPAWLLRISLIRELVMARPLFHELGHHIQAEIVPEYREREGAAVAWSRKLGREYLESSHRLFLPIFKILKYVAKVVKRRQRDARG